MAAITLSRQRNNLYDIIKLLVLGNKYFRRNDLDRI